MLSPLRNTHGAILAHCMKCDIIYKTESKQCIALPPKDWATATIDMHREFVKVRPCRFWDMQTYKQTDKQTYSSQYFAPLLEWRNNTESERNITIHCDNNNSKYLFLWESIKGFRKWRKKTCCAGLTYWWNSGILSTQIMWCNLGGTSDDRLLWRSLHCLAFYAHRKTTGRMRSTKLKHWEKATFYLYWLSSDVTFCFKIFSDSSNSAILASLLFNALQKSWVFSCRKCSFSFSNSALRCLYSSLNCISAFKKFYDYYILSHNQNKKNK